ncbi:hypothetical protein D3C87_1771130 [compost metagenome]
MAEIVVVLDLFVFHLDKQQQYQLGNVVAVIDAVVAEDVAKVPEFLDYVAVCHSGALVKSWGSPLTKSGATKMGCANDSKGG